MEKLHLITLVSVNFAACTFFQYSFKLRCCYLVILSFLIYILTLCQCLLNAFLTARVARRLFSVLIFQALLCRGE